MNAEGLVEHLAVASGFRPRHQDPLRGEEGEIVLQIPADRPGDDDEPAGDVGVEDKLGVGGEEGLRENEAARGRIVERPLEPLRGRGLPGRHGQAHHEPAEAAHPLGTHRIAFVGHRRGADLILLEGLFELPRGGRQPEIVARLVG